MATRGLKLAREMKSALRAAGCRFVASWDDLQIPETRRPADIQACLPPDGLSILVECKETRVNRIDFARIDDLKFSTRAKPANNQRLTLLRHAQSGGLSIIAVQRIWSNRSRTWLIPFQQWEQLRSDLSRQSIPLDDAKRPEDLFEADLSQDFRSTNLPALLQQVRALSLTLPLIDYRRS